MMRGWASVVEPAAERQVPLAQALQVPSSPGRLWSKGSRPEAGWGGVCHGESASTASSSIWGGPRAGATGGGRSGMRILVLYTPAASAVPRGS